MPKPGGSVLRAHADPVTAALMANQARRDAVTLANYYARHGTRLDERIDGFDWERLRWRCYRLHGL